MSNDDPHGRAVAYGVPGSQPVAASKFTSLNVSSASPAPLVVILKTSLYPLSGQ